MNEGFLTQTLVSGVLLGGLYGLLALGLSIVFGVMRIINIAHGTLMMLGAYVTFYLFDTYQFNPLLSLFVSGPLLFLFGAVLHRIVIRRLVGAPDLTSLLVTYGISIIMVNLALYAFTADFRSVPYLTGSISAAGVDVSVPRLVTAAIAVLVGGGLYAFLKLSRLGKAIRATSQNREAARVCGISVERVDMIAFGLGSALAGIAGSLISMMFAIFPEMGDMYTLKAFSIVVLGGMGSMLGVMIGGMFLGLAESIAALTLTTAHAEGVTFVVLIVVLLVRYSGRTEGGRA